jgi:beta propeller repeat protein
MKSKSIVVLVILLAVASGFSGLVQAKQVTENSYEDSSPFIDENIVVWQGLEGNDWEIFLYDISDPNAEPIQITNNAYGDTSPQTDGNYVVWLGFSDRGGEVFLYNISTKDTLQITNDSNVDSRPRIANGRVVWTSHKVGDSVEPGEILLYDIGAQATTTLSASVDPDGTLDDSSPKIDDESVIWVQKGEGGATSLFIHYLDNGTSPAPVADGFVWPNSPQTDGNLTVLTRYNGSDRDVFVYDSDLKSYELVNPPNDLEDRDPHISGNHIVWVRGEGAASEIFLAESKYIDLISPANGVVLPKEEFPTFTWNTIGYEKFRVQFSKAPDFPSKKTLTLPGGKKKWLSEAFFTPTRSEWSAIKKMERKNGYVYWRVKAKDADGDVAFSQASIFSIE